MKRIACLTIGAALSLTACAEVNGATGDMDQKAGKLPESVLKLAATNQNLDTARLDAQGRCYVYRYNGPVETTMLPLRTPQGNPICLQKPEADTAEA